tara:strand:- start:1161 stop:3932 length:2772 start_codon:yes stop_codon:yes gene_type:complete
MSAELENLVIRLVGDNSNYRKMIDEGVALTQQLEKEVAAGAAGQAQATGMADRAQEQYNRELGEAAATTRAAATPTQQYENELEKLNRQQKRGMINADTHARAIQKLNQTFVRGAARAAKFGKSMRNTGIGMGAVGTGMTFGLTMPIVGIGLAMAKAGSDAEETDQKFGVVFRDVAKSAKDMTDELDQSFGLTQHEAKTLLSDTGDLLSGFGFTGAAALDMSGQIQKLAVDLASFTNVEGGAKHASHALTKALLGEREMAKMLGIAIQREDIDAQKLANTKAGLTYANDRQAESYAVLQIMQRQSANAIGDYARSSDGLANQTRELWGDIKDLSASFGTVLLPAVKSVVKALRKGIAWVRGLSDGAKRMILIFGGIVAAIGPLLMVVGAVVAAIGAAIAGIAGLVAIGLPAIAVVAAIAAKILLVVGAALAVGAAVGAAAYYLIGREGLAAGWDYIVTVTKKWATMTMGFLENFRHNIGVLMKWLPANWDKLFKDIGRIYVTWVKNSIKNAAVLLKALFRIFNVLQGYFYGLWRKVFSVDFLKFVWKGITKVAAIYTRFAKWSWEAIKSIFTGDSASITDFGAQMASDFQKGANTENLLATIGDIAKEEMGNLSSPMEGFESSIEDAPEFSYEVGQKAGEQLAEGLKDAVDKAAPDVVDPVAVALLEDITKLEEKLQEQISTFGMAGTAIEIWKLQQKGATDEQLKAAKALTAELAIMEKAEKLKQKAEQLTKKHLSPLKKLTEAQNELNEMMEKGLIDVHTHTEAMAELQKEFDKEMKVKITVEGVDAALAGTAEAEARLREFRANAMGALDIALPDEAVRGPGNAMIEGLAAFEGIGLGDDISALDRVGEEAIADLKRDNPPQLTAVQQGRASMEQQLSGTDANRAADQTQVVDLLRVMADGITQIVDEDTMTLISADLEG